MNEPRNLKEMMLDASKHTCTMCGKSFDIFDLRQQAKMDHWCGYGSCHDESHIKFELCNHCFDKVMDELIPICTNSQVVFDETFSWLDDTDISDDKKERIKSILTAAGERKAERINNAFCLSYTPEYLTVVEEEMRREGFDIDSVELDMSTWSKQFSKWLDSGKEKNG